MMPVGYGNSHHWSDAIHPAGDATLTQQPMMAFGIEKARLNKDQIEFLEMRFLQQHKPSTADKKDIAHMLGVTLEKINNWFQNRRAKEKQEVKKRENAEAMMHEAIGNRHAAASFFHLAQSELPYSAADHSNQLQPHHQPSISPSAQPANCEPPFQQPHQIGFNPLFSVIPGNSQEHLDESGLYAAQTHCGSHQSNLLPHDSYCNMQQAPLVDDGMHHAQYATANESDLPTSPPIYTNFLPPSLDISPAASNGALSIQPPNTQALDSLPASAQLSLAMAAAGTFGNAQSLGMSSSTVNGWSPDSSSQSPPVTDTTSPSEFGSSSTEAILPRQTSSQCLDDWQSSQSTSLVLNNDQGLQASSGFEEEPAVVKNEVTLSNGHYETPVELLFKAPERRDSSASMLAETMSSVGLTASPDAKLPFKQPAPQISLAARRRGPRPAALGMITTRSSSYSGQMPASPGTGAGLQVSDPALRRIRSTVLDRARIQKSIGPAQRSPLAHSFAEAAASPRYMRHASNATNVSSPTASIGTNSIAPATPGTPALHNWLQFQNAAPDSTSAQSPGVASSQQDGISWAEDVAQKQFQMNVSPPETPYYAHQLARYQANMQSYMQSHARDTPPQSAPATQQHFAHNTMAHHNQPWLDPVPESQARGQYLRRPSLPGGGHAVSLSMIQMAGSQIPPVPMFNAAGGLELNTPTPQYVDHGAFGINRSQMSDNGPTFSNPFESASDAQSTGTPTFVMPNYPNMDPNPALSPGDLSMNQNQIYFNMGGPHDYQVAT